MESQRAGLHCVRSAAVSPHVAQRTRIFKGAEAAPPVWRELTSSRRSRRCMAFPRNVDVSESAGYPPAKKGKKKNRPIMKKIFFKGIKFKRETDRCSQVPVQLRNEDSDTQLRSSRVQKDKAQPGAELGSGCPAVS